MGKTALAAQLMDHLANAAGALYLTKEMRATALVKRLISKDIGRSTGAIRKGDANGMQSVMNSAQWRIQRNRLHYRDADTMTIATVETMVRVFTARGCRFFCIDYLQLMKPTKETAKLDRRHQIADITGRLKALAMKLEVTIFLVSQIARLEDDTRPELRNLSESKSIEDDSDKVILLHRTLGSRQAEVKVAKDRNGPTTGWLDLGFRPETTSFENLERA